MHLKIIKISVILLIVISLINCQKKADYSISNYFSTSDADTLLTNILTYVAKKPKTADWQSRFDPKYRTYYVKQLPSFEMKYYHVSEDSIHYFYMIRPARSSKGNLRGVGGKFQVNRDFEISEFEEVFNTPVLPKDSLEMLGKEIFSELIVSGNIDKLIDNKMYVEWPDGRLLYDKSIHDWRYQ